MEPLKKAQRINWHYYNFYAYEFYAFFGKVAQDFGLEKKHNYI